MRWRSAELKEIRAAGISVLSPKVDIANVRLEFADGCIANLTASRVSTEKVRKLRLFQPRQYISLDYAKQSAAVFKVGGPEGIAFEQLPIESAEPLKLQFDAFLDGRRNAPEPETERPRGPSNIGSSARRSLIRSKSTRAWSRKLFLPDGNLSIAGIRLSLTRNQNSIYCSNATATTTGAAGAPPELSRSSRTSC